MKKCYLSLLALLLLNTLVAQQRPHYTQYVLNNYILNPALTGIENYTDMKLSVRDQWVGLKGAPQTVYLSVHGPIGKKDYKTSATSFQPPGENPRGTAYWESYTASEPHHGLGLSVLNDRTGNFNRFTANLSYAYHIGLNPVTNLAAGFAGGITSIGRDQLKTVFADGTSLDPAVANTNYRRLRPDLNAGLWLYSPSYFVGLSAQQVVPLKLNFINDAAYDQGKLVPHLFATAGYRYLLNEEINALPSVMLKFVPNTPAMPQVDVNLKLQYLDLLWAGGSYRVKDGFAAMLGLNVANTFHIGYAYDFTRTPLNTTNRGTHELLLGFLINNRFGDTCPRKVW
ncbi:type IX secretion system membrane protein PorP/SprF [Paraflavisolibacter sp. H34]|uniref:PorP/SprF family type IX secretion system membrane protein n=1 Tax=Huijunlia imazamoxiresistens TaxID=3127457 RepID=UPI003016984C